MLIKLIFALVVLFLLWRGMNQLKKLPTEKRKAVLLKGLLWGLVAAVLLGVVTGRMHWVGAIIAGLIPFLRFGLRSAVRILPFWISRTGGVAPFRTEFLDIKIHIQKMQIVGTITKGQFAGRDINQLAEADLKALEAEVKDKDTKSYYLVRLIRQRRASDTEHEFRSSPPPFSQPARDEALQILGLSGNPSREDIIAAHRRLINKLHPDRGGSDFLAARVNQARDVLLGD